VLLFRLVRTRAPGAARGIPEPARLHHRPAHPHVSLPAERVGDAGDHERLATSVGRPPSIRCRSRCVWTTAVAFVTLGALLHRELYAPGFTRAQEGAERFVRGVLALDHRVGARAASGGEAGVRAEGHPAVLPRTQPSGASLDLLAVARRGSTVQRQSAAVVLGEQIPPLLRHDWWRS